MDLNIERCDCIIKSQFIHRGCWIFIFQLICDPLSDLSTNQEINRSTSSSVLSMGWFEGNSAEQYRFPPIRSIRLGVSCRFSETNSGMSGFFAYAQIKGMIFHVTMVRAEPTELSCKKAPQPKNIQKLCAQSVKETTLSTIG